MLTTRDELAVELVLGGRVAVPMNTTDPVTVLALHSRTCLTAPRHVWDHFSQTDSGRIQRVAGSPHGDIDAFDVAAATVIDLPFGLGDERMVRGDE